jgi:type I restriction enzyme S subunit
MRIGSGITPRGGASVYKTSGRPFVRSQNVGWGDLRLADLAYIDDATHTTFPATEIHSGDVLLNITGASIGRSAVATSELAGGNVNQHVCEIRLKPGVMDPHFVNAVLNSRMGQDQIDSFQAGGNRQGLNFQQVGAIRVPALDFCQQKAAGIVSKDAAYLVSTLELLITKKQAIKQGMMQQLLTGKTRLPGFADSWSQVCLRDVGSTYGGLTGKTKADFGKGSASYVTFMEVMGAARLLGQRLERVNVRSNENQNPVQQGDVLFNGSSETPEEVALAAFVDFRPRPATFLNSFCFGYRVKRSDLIAPAYLAYFFRSAAGRMLVAPLAQGATRYNITKKKLLDLSLACPPVEEQRAIVAILRDCEDEITAVMQRLIKARNVKQGMMQELLTGRARLPVAGVAA